MAAHVCGAAAVVNNAIPSGHSHGCNINTGAAYNVSCGGPQGPQVHVGCGSPSCPAGQPSIINNHGYLNLNISTRCPACQATVPDPRDTLLYGRRPEDYFPSPPRYFSDSHGVRWIPTLPDGPANFVDRNLGWYRGETGRGAVARITPGPARTA